MFTAYLPHPATVGYFGQIENHYRFGSIGSVMVTYLAGYGDRHQTKVKLLDYK
jgi:hypothetical protein